VTQNTEHEIVARNIMAILKRTGDIWRPLSRDEYEAERLKDGGFTGTELTLFDNVRRYCENAIDAQLFSPMWRKD
jgi:hypothetical protein